MSNDHGVTILHQDEDLVVVAKPAGISVHSADKEKGEQSLLQITRKMCGNKRLWPVHRLDKPTSGIVLFARSKDALVMLQRRLGEDSTVKKYLCLVSGKTPSRGMISRPLKNKAKKKNQHALTHFKTIAWYPMVEASLVEVTLGTGRHHQIRRHMRGIDHQLHGDDLYGWENVRERMLQETGLSRLFLHAAVIEIRKSPENPRISHSCPLPEELESVLKMCGEAITF